MTSSRPLHRRSWGVVLLAALLLPAAAPTHAQAPPLQGLDDFIEAGMAEWGIPGLAVAVVHRDEVVHSRGYGVLRSGEERPVDEHTLFGIASVSKAFTAAALGILVDEGRLDWDDPVIRHLPEFRLYDPYVTETVTVRDLLAHRVGVGRMTGNRIQWLPARERTELMARIRHLGPEQTFRNGYVYSNVMYMVAGEVVRAVSGQSWDEFVEERIFRPLGMDRSNTSVTRIVDGENAAWPHQEIEGEVVPIPRRNFDNVGASASINSSVDQLTTWMRLHLGSPGEVDGIRLLSPGVVREMHRAQNALGDAGLSGGLASYGLGWRVSHYEGRRMSQHGGATDGMNTTLVLLPEEELGLVVVTNTFNSFTGALANRIMDRFLGVEDRPWDRNFRDSYLASYERAMAARDSVHGAREEGTTPSGPLADFTGAFYDSLYADVEVTLEEDELVITFWGDDDQVLTLEHWHRDTFRGHWRNPAQRNEFVWFTRDDSGDVNQLHIRWTLRPLLLQAGTYPANYTRTVTLHRTDGS
ncbi:MAG: serine hydrolase [Gemmatimonadales bacterium]|nr:MAG: serine hydrolase [Gemmatimonadales bacterium]